MGDGDTKTTFAMVGDIGTGLQYPWSSCLDAGVTLLGAPIDDKSVRHESHGGYVAGNFCSSRTSGVHFGYQLASADNTLIKVPAFGYVRAGIGLFTDWAHESGSVYQRWGWETQVAAVLPLVDLSERMELDLNVGARFGMALLKNDPAEGWKGTWEMTGTLFILLTIFWKPFYEKPAPESTD